MELSLYTESLKTLHSLAHRRLIAELRRFDAFLVWKAGYKPDQARVPAGNPDGGQWTRIGGADDAAIARRRNWARPETLQKHHIEHGRDLNAKSAEDYARMAQEFGKRAHGEKLPTVVDKNGVTRTYDPKTNTFGAYNKDGSTRSFYKPKNGTPYFQERITRDVSRGGRVINPLDNTGGPENSPYRGTRINPPPYANDKPGGGGGSIVNDPDNRHIQE